MSLLHLFFNFQFFVFNFSYCGSVPLYLFFNFSTVRLQLFVLRKCPSYTCSSTVQLFVFNFSYYGSVPPILVLQLFNFPSSTFRIAEVSLLYLFFNFSTFRLQLFILRKCSPLCLFFNFSTFRLQLFVLRKCPSYTVSSTFNFSSSTFRIAEVSLYTCSLTFQFFVFNFSYYGSVPPILLLQLFNFPSSTFRITEVSLLYLFFNFSTFHLQLFVLRKCPSCTCSSTCQLFVFSCSYYGSVRAVLVLQLFNFSSLTFRIAEVSELSFLSMQNPAHIGMVSPKTVFTQYHHAHTHNLFFFFGVAFATSCAGRR